MPRSFFRRSLKRQLQSFLISVDALQRQQGSWFRIVLLDGGTAIVKKGLHIAPPKLHEKVDWVADERPARGSKQELGMEEGMLRDGHDSALTVDFQDTRNHVGAPEAHFNVHSPRRGDRAHVHIELQGHDGGFGLPIKDCRGDRAHFAGSRHGGRHAHAPTNSGLLNMHIQHQREQRRDILATHHINKVRETAANQLITAEAEEIVRGVADDIEDTALGGHAQLHATLVQALRNTGREDVDVMLHFTRVLRRVHLQLDDLLRVRIVA
mmetsp:Transcript_12512/g.22391  ORF Transcript_12512/g.22391 Transcript_12512/m.22391 type:complete len:267 (-) Transcript_12512:2846-3646(-)